MRKRISLKTRRPDLTREAFRAHYENEHVPLGLKFIDRFRWRRYVRNHVLTAAGAPIFFDCFAEFWIDDDFDDAALEEFVRSSEFQALDRDDRRFLDITKRASFDVLETPLVHSTGDEPGGSKVAIVWKSLATSAEARRATARRIVDSLEERVAEAVLDTAIGTTPPEAPFDTMLTLRARDSDPVDLDPALLPGSDCSVMFVEPVETPRELLVFA